MRACPVGSRRDETTKRVSRAAAATMRARGALATLLASIAPLLPLEAGTVRRARAASIIADILAASRHAVRARAGLPAP